MIAVSPQVSKALSKSDPADLSKKVYKNLNMPWKLFHIKHHEKIFLIKMFLVIQSKLNSVMDSSLIWKGLLEWNIIPLHEWTQSSKLAYLPEIYHESWEQGTDGLYSLDASMNLIYDSDSCCFRRHKASDLSQEDNQCHLSEGYHFSSSSFGFHSVGFSVHTIFGTQDAKTFQLLWHSNIGKIQQNVLL